MEMIFKSYFIREVRSEAAKVCYKLGIPASTGLKILPNIGTKYQLMSVIIGGSRGGGKGAPPLISGNKPIPGLSVVTNM